MELLRGTTDLRAAHRGGVVTLGSFDGLHRGHQVLLARTLEWANRISVPSAMLTFEPMPREFLQAANPPPRLTNFRERWRLLEPTGLNSLIVLRFNDRLRSLTGEEFVEILTRDLAVHGLVVGHDFRFGKAGQADAGFLVEAGRRHGFAVEVIEPVSAEGERVSSTVIRDALAAGRFDQARVLLGRPYSIRGRVVPGAKLGRQLGFPTANIRVRRRKLPLGGIYAVRVHGITSRVMGGVASLGTRPTVDGVEPLLETFVFDFSGDLYGQELEIEFVAHLRNEERFESLDALVAQMRIDERRARDFL
jgi:riboflavin kinase/FMN adenylyltransferase